MELRRRKRSSWPIKHKVDTFAQRSIEVARRNVPRAQFMSEIQQYDLGWNITKPDARLVRFYNEMRAHATADPPQ